MSRSALAGSAPRHRGVAAIAPLAAAALAAGAAASLTVVLPPIFVAAGVLGLVALLAVRAFPWIALLGMAATRAALEGTQTISLVGVGGVGLSLADLVTLAFLGGCALYLFDRVRSGARLLSAPTAAPALAFIGWAGVTLLYSPQLALGARDLLKFSAAYAAYLVIVAERPDPRRLTQLLATFVIGAVPVIVFGFAPGATDVNIFSGWARVESVFDSANTYGFYLVSVLAAVWALRQRVSGTARLATSVVGIASVVSVMLTLSRNSFAAMSILVLVVGWRQRRMLIAALAVSAIVLLVVPQTLDRGSEFFSSDSASTRNSLTGRLGIWAEGARLWQAQPVLGRGWGTTSLTVGKNTHNDYLRTLIEAGAVGLVCYVALVVTLIKAGIRAAVGRADACRALLGLALGYALVSVASNSLGKGAFQFYFWVAVGLLYTWSETIPPPLSVDDAQAARVRVSSHAGSRS